MRDGEHDWHQDERAAVAGLLPVSFLEGTWTGVGTAHGQALRGRMVARRSLRDTWLEVREQLLDEGGAVDHEDLHLYRYDTEDAQLMVLHVAAPARRVDHQVVLEAPPAGAIAAFFWFAGPFAPRVHFRWDGEHLQVDVTLPFEAESVSTMRYHRIATPG